MERKLKTLHVMPLLPGRERELAADAEALLNDGICTDVAAIMTLVPEGDPPEDKARILGERFTAFRKVFKGDASRLGILAQATMGHGWAPDEPSRYQKTIRPDGTSAYRMCPLDVDFQEYIRNAFQHLVRLSPAFFMIDDDFRLLTGRNGCFCPLHLAEIGRRLGRNFTRTDLVDVLRTDSSAAHEYDALLLDSLMKLAGVIRQTIDETDRSIPASFCACYGDIRHAGPLARCLAGAGNAPLVRINNARYMTPEMRSFPIRMYQGAAQIAGLDSDITILAETDTCPHNRYSTGARLLHAHYTGSILEGCHGAKHWLTRIHTFQPTSGTAYRAILKQYRGFYQALFRAVQESVPADYVAAALPSVPMFNPAPDHGNNGASIKTWSALMGVLGLPCNYARMPNLPVMMTGEDVPLFSDEDLRLLLSNGLLLDGLAAEELGRRGFADAIGVRAESWAGMKVSAEQWGKIVLRGDLQYSRLEPLSSSTHIHSTLLHRQSGVSEAFSELGPAITLYENAAGGRVAVLAASCGVGNSLNAPGRSFYDEDRKRELVELLAFICGHPIAFHYPGDAEIYLKLRRLCDDCYLIALCNLGHDPLEDIPLVSPYGIEKSEILMAEGKWQEITYAKGCLQTSLRPAEPKVFRMTVTKPFR